MKRPYLIFFAIIGLALVLIVVMGIVGGLLRSNPASLSPEETQGFTDPESLPPNMVLVTIASSSTKQNWMEEVVKNFNAGAHTIGSSATIVVEVSPVLSGGSKDDILAGKLKPVAWSPGSDSWVQQINETWQQRTNKPVSSKECQATIYTPLGFAMWRPMAEALGWPDTPIGWQTIVELAANPDGWASYGRPEWGKFRFGHAHPQYSNAGLLTMTSFVYGITGKTDSLTAAEVYAPEVEAALTTLAQNTSKYGRITTDLLNLMALEGPNYLHTVATFESDTVQFNLERGDELQFPFVFIFPSEGTFWGSHPYCILDNAEWVTTEEAEAATIFLNYLLAAEQQTMAIEHRLRPLDSSIPLRAPLDLESGTDPRVNPGTVPPLADPGAQLGEAVIDLFRITKRKATVIIVLDTSGSMEGDKIQAATRSTADFLKRLAPDDEVSVVTFNDSILYLTEPRRVGDVSEPLSGRVSSLVAGGNTALYEAVCDATALVQSLQAADQSAGESRLYGIVLLSDGEDTVGSVTGNQMFATCLPANAEADGVKIFPIAFGAEADEELLQRIARVTGGRLFTADPDSIDNVYISISAEQ